MFFIRFVSSGQSNTEFNDLEHEATRTNNVIAIEYVQGYHMIDTIYHESDESDNQMVTFQISLAMANS